MPKLLRFYSTGVIIAAIGFCIWLDWSLLQDLSRERWIGFATFVLLAVLGQALAVESTVGASKPVKSSIAFLPLLALAVVMPIPAVVLATGAMTAANELLLGDRKWLKAGFNTAQTILSYGLAAVVFSVLNGPPAVSEVSGSFTGVFVPFYGLAATFFLLNLLFVSCYIAIRQGEPLVRILSQTVGSGGGNLLYDLLASPIALIAAYLYQLFFIGGLVAIVLPLLLIRHSYLSAIKVQRANRDLLRALVMAIETRDPYTSGHSLRVSNLARLIAEDFGLRPAVVERVETAALLHDIGKIDALYAQIISKSSSLTEDEWSVIQTHATKGADLLESLTTLERDVIEGVRYHHERYDGSGYPAGIRGKSIPIAARIIMLCDSVDAMLSDRPYRPALPLQQVREELRRCAGTQFDPDIVESILARNTLERAESLVERSGGKLKHLRAVAVS